MLSVCVTGFCVASARSGLCELGGETDLLISELGVADDGSDDVRERAQRRSWGNMELKSVGLVGMIWLNGGSMGIHTCTLGENSLLLD